MKQLILTFGLKFYIDGFRKFPNAFEGVGSEKGLLDLPICFSLANFRLYLYLFIVIKISNSYLEISNSVIISNVLCIVLQIKLV